MINSSFFKMVIVQLANCRKLTHGASFGEFEGPSFMLLQIFFSLFRSTLAVHTGHAMQKLSGLPAASLHALGPHPTSRLIAMGFPQSRFSRVIGGGDFKLPGTPLTFCTVPGRIDLQHVAGKDPKDSISFPSRESSSFSTGSLRYQWTHPISPRVIRFFVTLRQTL